MVDIVTTASCFVESSVVLERSWRECGSRTCSFLGRIRRRGRSASIESGRGRMSAARSNAIDFSGCGGSFAVVLLGVVLG